MRKGVSPPFSSTAPNQTFEWSVQPGATEEEHLSREQELINRMICVQQVLEAAIKHAEDVRNTFRYRSDVPRYSKRTL